jgi:Phage tail protein (Tail_P2_I)
MIDNQNRVPLYQRLPEIYRIKDQELEPKGQLKSYLELVEYVFDEIHKNIETLYHDLFIDTCDDWVIPYIGDLLGVSHLKGDSATLRADVAETIASRRRKGTLSGIERLVYNLTRWGVHCVELRENLVWNQHLNHQRPDRGGHGVAPNKKIRGGTVTLRDPAMLSLLNSPFDPFAHLADIKPPAFGNIRYNLPNLAIFLWRLKDYRVTVTKPIRKVEKLVGGVHCGFFYIHPQKEPLRLFNTYQFNPDVEPPIVTQLDQTPGPMPMARLTGDLPDGVPGKYVSVNTYDDTTNPPGKPGISPVGFQLHLPQSKFTADGWRIRGANLCAWEKGLRTPVKENEIVIDPVIGRFIIGVHPKPQTKNIFKKLFITYTYGAVGPVGAHPVSRPELPEAWAEEPITKIEVSFIDGNDELTNALNNMATIDKPLMILIKDSHTYRLNISGVDAGLQTNEGGEISLKLKHSLIIRAANDQRPVIQLVKPLRFRPFKVKADQNTDSQIMLAEQESLDANMAQLNVRLEGLYLTRIPKWRLIYKPSHLETPLIGRCALNRLEIIDCTLDPGGYKKLKEKPNNIREPIYTSLHLREDYGYPSGSAAEIAIKEAFNQIPRIVIQQSITGPLLLDSPYILSITQSIVDAGKGVGDDAGTIFAISSAADPINHWGPALEFDQVTVFGRVWVQEILAQEKASQGGIFVQTFEVQNHQTGCIKFSYFQGKSDRLPQNHACVKGNNGGGSNVDLRFVSEIFGQPAYGQLHHTTDFTIRERGPGDDAMGAFGFLMEAHKWRNLQIRFREFMPVGVRPLLIPVT